MCLNLKWGTQFSLKNLDRIKNEIIDKVDHNSLLIYVKTKVKRLPSIHSLRSLIPASVEFFWYKLSDSVTNHLNSSIYTGAL